MDPNATLRQLRILFAMDDADEETRDLFQALDEWLSNHGFLPDDWTTNKHNPLAGLPGYEEPRTSNTVIGPERKASRY